MSVNSVSVSGRLGKDPELRRTPSGKAVCDLRLAVDSGAESPPYWFSVVAWERTAELAAQYLRKGSLVFVSGRLSQKTWEDRDGRKRVETEIVIYNIVFGDRRDPMNQDNGHNPSNETQDPGVVDDDTPF